MRKIISAGLAALTLTSALAPALTASAQDRDGWRHDHDRYRGGNGGAALAAGLAGLAVGAAIANGGRGDYRSGYYYGPPRYAYDYYYGPRYYGPHRCATSQIWDPYVGGYVQRTRCW